MQHARRITPTKTLEQKILPTDNNCDDVVEGTLRDFCLKDKNVAVLRETLFPPKYVNLTSNKIQWPRVKNSFFCKH